MKILMINKFLHLNGGSETYIKQLGDYLVKAGNEVQYFGMDNENRVMGNRMNLYTTDMDFHGGSKLSKVFYPVKTIYSAQARKKLRKVLDDFCPDVCHLNNFNYQLTPSVILEIVKWRKEKNKNCKIVYTAHDYQLICPNHILKNPNTNKICEKCLDGNFFNCAKGRCIHGSFAKSIVGSMEAFIWNKIGVYKNIDKIICCSDFLKSKLDNNPILRDKTVTIHNFIDIPEFKPAKKKDYVLYFGRYSEEKGVRTLVEVCRELPEIEFVFAGKGPLEYILDGVKNIKNVGFLTGKELETLIKEARFSVCPSNCYENCPFSVMESICYKTPVLGADIGGIPELIEIGKTGELFESGNKEELKKKITEMYENGNCCFFEAGGSKFDTVSEYCDKFIKLIGDIQID